MTFKVVVALCKYPRAKKTSVGGKGRWVTGFQDAVFSLVNERSFLLGEGPPKHENHMFFFLRDRLNDIVGEFLPAKGRVGVGVSGHDRQAGV